MFMNGWVDLGDLFESLECTRHRVSAHSTVLIIAKPADYLYWLETLMQSICLDFPCRFILLKEEKETDNGSFLKAKLSYISAKKDSLTLCECIEIEYTSDQKKVLLSSLPKLLLPLLDVILLLWQEEKEHSSFLQALKPYLSRLIFDSEYAKDLRDIQQIIETLPPRIEVGDLNYTRESEFRKILLKELSSAALMPLVESIDQIEILYNPHKKGNVRSPLTQSFLLAEWIALWKGLQSSHMVQAKEWMKIFYNNATISILPAKEDPSLGEGAILSLSLFGKEGSCSFIKTKEKVTCSIETSLFCSKPVEIPLELDPIEFPLFEQLHYDTTNLVQMTLLSRILAIPYKRLLVGKTKEETFTLAKEHFLAIAREAIARRGSFRVALSGGKTPLPFYQLFRQEDLDWTLVEFLFSDERAVLPDHEESNYRRVRQAFSHLQTQDNQWFRMSAESPSDEAVLSYERLVSENLDLICLGMGQDGHTLSLFPNSEALKETDRLILRTVAPQEGPSRHRMSCTLTCVHRAANRLFLITGSEKGQMLKQVLQSLDPKLPAAAVRNTYFAIEESSLEAFQEIKSPPSQVKSGL